MAASKIMGFSQGPPLLYNSSRSDVFSLLPTIDTTPGGSAEPGEVEEVGTCGGSSHAYCKEITTPEGVWTPPTLA